MDKSSNLYEITYLIVTSLTDEEALHYHQTIKNKILDLGGLIETEGDIKKTRLSYPIKKLSEAYVTWCRFTLASAQVAALQQHMDQKEILRFLLVHTKPIPARQISTRVSTKPVHIETTEKHTAKQRTPEEPAASVEEIDKKLEEILGK